MSEDRSLSADVEIVREALRKIAELVPRSMPEILRAQVRNAAALARATIPAFARLTARAEAAEREIGSAMESLREFNHVEGEPLSEVAAVAVSAYGFVQHRADSSQARLAAAKEALRAIERIVAEADEADFGEMYEAVTSIIRAALAHTPAATCYVKDAQAVEADAQTVHNPAVPAAEEEAT